MTPFYSGAQTLSENSKIGFITCGPGDDLYSVFGHSAIRIQDSNLGIDYVFNYGTFDFNAPGFYTNFLLGYLEYFLSVSNFNNFLQSYRIENRKVEEQILHLSLKDKQSIFEFLKNNYTPENRFYRYDFLKDNCATKELDLLKIVLDSRLIIPDSVYEISNESYRDLIVNSLQSKPWTRVGINIVLGSYMDKKISAYQASFLPEYLFATLDKCYIAKDSTITPLVDRKQVHFQPHLNIEKKESNTINPILVFSLFTFVLWIFYQFFSFFHWTQRAIHFYFYLQAFLGICLFLLGNFTEHYVMANNFNWLWLNPLYLLLAIDIKIYQRNTLVYFFLFCNASLIVFNMWIPQKLDLGVYPFLILNSVLFAQFIRRKH
jgi:hypothetical protein